MIEMSCLGEKMNVFFDGDISTEYAIDNFLVSNAITRNWSFCSNLTTVHDMSSNNIIYVIINVRVTMDEKM